MISWEFHSPVTNIADFGLARPAGADVFVSVKRDDLIHPFVSGNKWRKLKYAFQDLQASGKKEVVTFGGAWSNHLLATACAGAVHGVRSTGFVRGDEVVSNPVLNLCRVYGMELIYVDRTTYRDKKLLFDSYVRTHAKPEDVYFIDEGGYSAEATEGCAEIIGELDEQFDHIFCACGTGATLAGLSKGLLASGLSTRLHGVPVLAGGAFIQEAAQELVPGADFELHLDYHFGGYAKTKPELLNFIKRFVSATGILIEPVYTGKLFYAVYDLIGSGYFNPGSRILILHSGGLTGFMGQQKIL